MINLFPALISEGYLCDQTTASAVEACLATRPTAGAFLFGPAGSGKTYLPEVLARILGREQHFFQCFPGTREDDLLLKLVPDPACPSGIAVYDGPVMEAAKASISRPVILTLDEWDKTRPSADSFLLDFLQSGRIKFNGRSCTANLRNLTVFLTMNDERELSEPLLRRLPLIHFSYLPASLVREALEKTHPSHPYISHAVILYERCILAGMPKPATIQELRQLLDAITMLGRRADWDSLVYQFVTKTRENHALLKSAEWQETRIQREERERLDPTAYEMQGDAEVKADVEAEQVKPRMPRLAEVRGMSSVADDAPGVIEGVNITPDLTDVGGVITLTDTAYDAVVGLASAPSEDPYQIGDAGSVIGNLITLRQSIKLRDYRKIDSLWGQEGEIVFTEPAATLADILALRSKGWKIVKYSTHEVLAKSEGVDLRWTPKDGAEIVVDLHRKRPDGSNLFGIIAFPKYDCNSSAGCEACWYGQCSKRTCGIIPARKEA